MDERGIREVAFYEAIQASTKRSLFKTYCSLFGPRDAHRSKRSTSIMLKLSDWAGLPLPWKSSNDRQSYDCCDPESVIKEAKLLHRLDLFTAEYYGLVEHKSKTGSYHPADVDADDQHQTCPYGTKYCSHILAGNLTINFSRPSVMDIKMGMQTYEPDAPEAKKMRERKKYELQEVLGFRIVALRIFDPSSVENAKDGYVYFPKSFGRSLISRDEVKRAFVKFFGGDGNGMLSKEVRKNRSKGIKKILSELKVRWCCACASPCFSCFAAMISSPFLFDITSCPAHSKMVLRKRCLFVYGIFPPGLV
jgi:Inositol polyphosphate kinase